MVRHDYHIVCKRNLFYALASCPVKYINENNELVHCLQAYCRSQVQVLLSMLNCGTDKDFLLVQFRNVTKIVVGHKTASGYNIIT